MLFDKATTCCSCFCSALVFLVICGCGRQTQEVEVPSYEEAREALINFCENASDQSYPNPDLKRMFSSPTLLEKLKRDGGFSDLSYLGGNFQVSLGRPGHFKYIVKGRFVKDASDKWRAEITGYSHILEGPEKGGADRS
ncbi:MAG: hypothetical protein HY040_20330 [Planctomycetes bacterium]|nr:hypothetical protein [Planctomycetota bacterium]